MQISTGSIYYVKLVSSSIKRKGVFKSEEEQKVEWSFKEARKVEWSRHAVIITFLFNILVSSALPWPHSICNFMFVSLSSSFVCEVLKSNIHTFYKSVSKSEPDQVSTQ